jgi:hypothetical protein
MVLTCHDPDQPQNLLNHTLDQVLQQMFGKYEHSRDDGGSILLQNYKSKLQFALGQAAKAQKGSSGIALLFLQPRL